jgi:hypothetical protein
MIEVMSTTKKTNELTLPLGTRQPAPTDAWAWRRLALGGLVVALVLQTTFAVAYIGALHNPQPHQVPIGVLDAGTAAALLAAGDAFRPKLEQSRAALLSALRERKISAGLVGSRLYVAKGGSFSTASYLEAVFRKQNPRLRTTDVAPLSPGDSRGFTLFYATIAWVFGGYFAATVMMTLLGAHSRSRRVAAERMAGLAAFCVAAGFAGALIADQAFGAIAGHFWQLAEIGMLIGFAAGAATAALQSLLGVGGTLVGLVAFVMFGNAASGGAYAGAFIPGFWRAIGPWLPSGAGVSGLRGAVYFGGANITGRLLVLGGYAAVGVVVAVAAGWRRGLRAPELELASAAAV